MKVRHLSKIQWLILLGLTAFNLNHAFANGVDRGGDGTVLTLESLLPKTIQQRVTIGFEKFVPDPYISEEYLPSGFVPYVETHPCGSQTCFDKAQGIVFDITLKLGRNSGNNPTYKVASHRVLYALNGQWKPLTTGIDDEYDRDPIQLFSFIKGYEKNHEAPTKFKGTGEWRQLLTDFLPEVRLNPTPNVKFQIWLDGAEKDARSFPVQHALIEAQERIESQTDYSDIKVLSDLKDSLIVIQRLAYKISETIVSEHLNGDMGLHAFRDELFEEFFLKRMNADQSSLIDFGKALVAQDGTCNKNKYKQLLARLKAWTAGSPAYFYEIDQPGQDFNLRSAFKDKTQILSMGIRQTLRRELDKVVVPYCEAQSTRPQIDLILNDK